MRSNAFVSACILLLVACSGPAPKVFEPIEKPLAQLPVKTRWVARVGDIGEHQYRQLPTVIRGDKIYVATNQGDIMALDPQSGLVLWRGHTYENILSGPEVEFENDKPVALYITTNNAEVIALKPESLDVIWRSKISSEVLQAPVIAADKLIVQSIDGKIAALAKKDGASLWVESREVPLLTLRGTARPLVDGDKLFTGFANGSVSALNLSNGKTLWETNIAVARGRSDVERVVDVDGLLYQDANAVYASSMQGRIAAISKATGQLIWVRDMSAYVGVVSDGKSLYVSDAESRLWALDINSGATLWRNDELKGRDISAPAIVKGDLVVGDGAGIVHWLSSNDGKLQTQVVLNKVYEENVLVFGDETTEGRQPSVTTEPVGYNGAVYVRDNLGALTVMAVEHSS